LATVPKISVVVLAYRSAETIREFVDQLVGSLEACEPAWEIILVGNYLKGQDDRTPEVVRSIAENNERIVAITREKEGMMGWDMKTGLSAAKGETIAVIDGDGQMPFEDVARVYRKMKEEQCDLAKTFRVRRDDGVYRKILSGTYNYIFKLLFPGLHCRDMNSKPKIMTRAVYERMDLKSNGWFIDAEIMIQARRFGLIIKEVPTSFQRIDCRPSFIKPLVTLDFLGNLLWSRITECQWWFKRSQ